ncbi:MAG: cache domain-containing protein [Eubacterium sp.]|nr:cache domain-containing protein [Eubacterium sp.]
MNEIRKNNTARIAVIGSLILAVILVAGTIWMGHYARRDTEEAVREVSLLYLDELAGRREQVVENNLQEKIQTVQIAIDLMTEEDLSDKAHMEDYQTRMKQLLKLDKFAFVDTDGRIYSSRGMDSNISDYTFDYRTLSEPEISVIDQADVGKRVVIAVPVNVPFQDETLSVCFISIDMDDMLAGVSMTTNTGDATFCNIYTDDGMALTNAVLGGLAEEDNLLNAMKIAVFEEPYSYDQFVEEFQSGTRGVVSFTYNDIRETLAYIPVGGTDCQLTYLIRENVISDRIGAISDGTVRRSIMQSVLTVAAMLIMFGFIIAQTKRNSRLILEKETADTENRVKQEELEHRLELQEKLLAEERQTKQQSRMITALSSDYWSVYYLDLETDDGVCYQSHGDLDGTGFKVGEEFKYLASVTAYANQYITEPYLEPFLAFIQPDAVREGLRKSNVISYTYMVTRHGKETYETVRFAAMKDPNDPSGRDVNHVGACFADVDAETRKSIRQN